jgi:hypothetical protein
MVYYTDIPTSNQDLNMMAIREGNTVRMSNNIASALAGTIKGYRVTMHAKPQHVFEVEASNGDEAVRLVVALCRKEGLSLPTDAATFQRMV